MTRKLLPLTVVLALTSGIAIAGLPGWSGADGTEATATAESSSRPTSFESAPRDAWRLPFPEAARGLMRDLDAWYGDTPTHRAHVQLDRPLYRPGETVSLKVWDLTTRALKPAVSDNVSVSLIDAHGVTVETKSLAVSQGSAVDSFALGAQAAGGSWKIQLALPSGEVVERPFVVNNFQPPRIKKTVEFARDGYGPGEAVEASLTLARATGEKLANVPVMLQVLVDGAQVHTATLQTNAAGEALVKFNLPAQLSSPDVNLVLLVDDAGVTESISRSVPVALDRVNVAFYPEGGDLVVGISSRIYFEATDAHGGPADIQGTIVDDRGKEVTRFESWVDGRGHVTITPEKGRSYQARLQSTAKLVNKDFALPASSETGCVLRHHDDLDGAQQAVRVSVTCNESRTVYVVATQQEQILDRAALRLTAGQPTTVHLQSALGALSGAQGVARVTVLDEDLAPMAERLVYRNRSRQMKVQIVADRDKYAPKDNVVLTVKTTDPEGRPVPAELAMSVIDDTLLAYADDKEHDLASRVLLQADLPDPIEGASAWFDAGSKDGALALDLAMGTRGWRRFDWSNVAGYVERKREEERQARMYREEESRWHHGGVPDMAWGMDMEMAAPMAGAGFDDVVAIRAEGKLAEKPKRLAKAPEPMAPPTESANAEPAKEDGPVRQFAVAIHADPAKSLRSDFRETVLWEPVLKTGSDGYAKVRFPLNDAVTSFRAHAEGIGGGLVGQGDALLKSTLPFHLEARLPVELSTGDQALIPVTLESQRDQVVAVKLDVKASSLLDLGELNTNLTLTSNERRTIYVPVTAEAGRGAADLTLFAVAGSLSDGISQAIPVVPRGFPLHQAFSGRLDGEVTQRVMIAGSTPGSITGTVSLMPTPVSELMSGMAGMVRQPGGCFEQTSSTNYPNVVILDYLDRAKQGGGAGAISVDRKQVLGTGYDILTGYRVQSGGFETWGDGPGKEALTAFGLLEFHDMSKVYPVDPGIIQGNVKYLLEQRTGQGGYQVTGSSAHGYGTAPPEVLDAYITYALVETGQKDLSKEISAQVELSRRTNDPYRLSLATLSLLSARPDDGKVAAERLAKLQNADGSFPGSETSITRSENYNLDVEATALAVMALNRAGNWKAAQNGVKWIHDHQTGPGVWGASQSNALALKAVAEMSLASAQTDSAGHLVVSVDGKRVAETRYEAGRTDPVELNIGSFLTEGGHDISVKLDGSPIPYVLDVGWNTLEPASAPERRLELEATLGDDTITMGHTTRLSATLSNRTKEIVPDPIARIGLPAGLTAQVQQLEEMKERGDIAFFELRPREVTIYWDGLAVNEKHVVNLDLVAQIPGKFTGPASSAYPYYDDQAKAWVSGMAVTIEP